MSPTESNELSEVLDRVKRWSDADRFALVKEVLETLAPRESTISRLNRGRSAKEIRKTFKTDQPAPDDQTIRQWIDERRMGKYGS
jgi:hypothetical protein